MTIPFRARVARSLGSEEQLSHDLDHLSDTEWQELAQVLAASLPDFDAVLPLPGTEQAAAWLGRARGLPEATTPDAAGPRAIVLAAQLCSGEGAAQRVEQAQAAGWQVLMVVSVVERTSKGARLRLARLDIPVRALVQVADTPAGLIFERRTPDRWAS